MDLYRLSFNTASKNADEIKANYDPSPPSTEILEKMAESFRNLNGTEVIGAVWSYSPHSYSLYAWDDNDDEKFKELIYWIEQDDFSEVILMIANDLTLIGKTVSTSQPLHYTSIKPTL